MDRGAWWARVHRVAQSWTRLKLRSTHTVSYSTPPLSPLREHHVYTNRAIPGKGITGFVLMVFPTTLLELYRGNHLSLQRRKWQSTPVFLPGESQGRGSLVGCRLWDHTESDTRLKRLSSRSSISPCILSCPGSIPTALK